MKTLAVVTAVVLLHVIVIGGVFMIGGCKSMPPSMKKKSEPPPLPPVVEAPTEVLPPPPPPPPPAPVAERTYTVKKGDTLSKIARTEGVPLTALLSANNLTMKSIIRPGQILTVPSREGVAPLPEGGLYVVAKGDSLSKIARTHGTSVEALAEVNNLTSDIIRVGQKLKIPPPGYVARRRVPLKAAAASKPTTAAVPVSGGAAYQVQSGDTPGGIAKKFGVKVDDLMRANNISDPRKLRVGQTLVIPGKTAPPAAVPTTTLPPPPPPPAPKFEELDTVPPPPPLNNEPAGTTVPPPPPTF